MQNVGLGVSLGSDTKEMRQIEIAKITSSKDIYIYICDNSSVMINLSTIFLKYKYNILTSKLLSSVVHIHTCNFL